MKIKLLLLLLLLSLGTRAEDVYHVHQLSEEELLKTYTSVMRDACHHADQFWTNWSVDTNAGMWGSGRSDNMNEGIRSISDMVLTCGALIKYSDAFDDVERKEYRRKAIAAIRYATASHVTGPQKCTDGKHWGNSWQSPMWTADMTFGAQMIWDDLDADLRKDLERVVAFEADRFLSNKPPAGTFNDTKAEENGWDLTCIAVAATMFPKHPHADAWHQKAIEYMVNTLSAPQDETDKRRVDGKPVSEWFSGANVHPDFTLENHGFFHPGYVGCSSYFLTQTAMYYTFAHRPVPQAATHHLMDEWGMFQGIILPNGEAACPQSMDWELHGLPYVNLFASLASYQHDPLAAHLEETYMQYMRAWQVMCNGDLAVSGSKLGFTRHAVCAGLASYSFLAHKIFGPPVKEIPAAKAAAVVEGTHTYDWIQVVTHRTEDKFVSFSWTNRIMGMAIPLGAGHEGNPDFTVPMINGFIGNFDLTPAGGKEDKKTTVSEHSWKKNANGFETSGVLLLNGGRLKQTLQVTSIGDKTVVYQDRVIAQADVTVAQERGFPVAVENDPVTGGRRHVTAQFGGRDFTFEKPQPPVALPGFWANVDGRLGLIMAAGTGLAYHQATGYQPGISVCPDILYGSFSKQPREFKTGDTVAHRIAVIYLETSPEETAKLEKTVLVHDGPHGQILHFKLPEGGESEIPLF